MVHAATFESRACRSEELFLFGWKTGRDAPKGVVVGLTLKATWGTKSSVWVPEREDMPGLVTEAESPERRVSERRVLITALLGGSAD